MAFYQYTLSANGTAGPHGHLGGKLHWQAKGTFGSGTLSVQVDFGPGFTEVATCTSEDEGLVVVPDGARVQYVLTGATGPSISIADRT